MKTVIRYEVREFVGNKYSKMLGRKLRSRRRALKIKRKLSACGCDIVICPLSINI